ncbi:hypothetical protein Hamer_G008156 [Homarus americanus]|uniref:Uncharacterized protein n=1 Tax=Homarus americanus TaxID=6706 RepID=A0A8J5NE96_HOMAM|nr:hypothetical protein Hamer_G008156 [Homarus americanus]
MYVCTKIIIEVADMTGGYKQVDTTTHKEERPSRICADNQDQMNVQDKFQCCVDPLDKDDHPEGISNIITGRVAPESVNVHQAADLSKAQLVSFENSLPSGFHAPLLKKVIARIVTKKFMRIADKDVYDNNLIYSRVLGLQHARDIGLTTVLKYELAPLPTSMFTESGDMYIATSKMTLKKKLQVLVSARLSPDPQILIIDGCGILWCVHWSCKGTVQDCIDIVCSFILHQTKPNNPTASGNAWPVWV